MELFFPYEGTYNYYGDESCHLLNDGNKYMALGALCCPKQMSKQLCAEIRQIKLEHNLSKDFEIKSTKVSSGAYDFYEELIRWFLDCNYLVFRVILIDKNLILHKNKKDYNLFYYKMYYILFKWYMYGVKNHIYLDYKDSQSSMRCAEIEQFLSNDRITKMKTITVKQINSKESNLMQLSDLIIGLTCYNASGKTDNHTKLKLIQLLKEQLDIDLISTTNNAKKFDAFEPVYLYSFRCGCIFHLKILCINLLHN